MRALEAPLCIYAFMLGKRASANVYSMVWQRFIAKAAECGVDSSTCDWDVMTDFENTELSAFREVMPNCAVHGCGFQYTQALMKI